MASSPSGSPDVLIIGAGVGGLTFAISLQRQLGFKNFVIIEKASEIGGTWRDNIYPGCASDTPVHFYSLSTDLSPNWSRTHCFNDEILKYWVQLTDKYNLRPRIQFNREVSGAEWDAEKQRWHVTTKDLKSGDLHVYDTRIVISASGLLGLPRIPKIEGLSNFGGSYFHTAQWKPEVDLKGKRVAVIGSGSSAIQCVPGIAKEPTTQVTHFIRTATWLPPAPHTPYWSIELWLFRTIPGLLRLSRWVLFLKFEILYALIWKWGFTRWILQKVYAEPYMKLKAPKQYIDKLMPNYTVGCKRIVYDTGYFAALHKPNLTPKWDGISKFDKDGIVTKTGEHVPLDVVVFATGFTTNYYPIPIKGSTGQTLQEYYDSQGGGKAYLGTSFPGFPNFYMMAGPNTVNGHGSALFTYEVQSDYLIQLIKPVLDGAISSVDVTTTATEEYNDKIQRQMQNTVYIRCNSWYRKGGNGKVTSAFPGSAIKYWWWLRKPNWNHYAIYGQDGKEVGWKTIRDEKSNSVSYSLGCLVVAAVGVLISLKFRA
ncbi:hypothetical protein AX16_010925 [Volvariella volvacea WC 439]|nr:hypothetical protein AX16_010925 [Volvariella volvacea WC 439]